jgi:c(7)-type cytochrome triheme protein
MKKLAFLLIPAFFLCYAVILSASGDTAAVEEEYDEDLYGPEAPIIWNKPVRGVIFEHSTHTMGGEMDCDSCHDDLFEMEAGAAEENEDFVMQTMYDGGYCGACHDGATAFAANTRCTACHIGVRGVARLLGESDGGHSGH